MTWPLARGLLVAWAIRGWSRRCCPMPSDGRWRTGRSGGGPCTGWCCGRGSCWPVLTAGPTLLWAARLSVSRTTVRNGGPGSWPGDWTGWAMSTGPGLPRTITDASRIRPSPTRAYMPTGHSASFTPPLAPDVGNGAMALQACMFAEPAGSGLVAAPPVNPADGVAGRFRLGERVGEQSPDLPDAERDEAGIGGRDVAWPDGGRGRGVGPVPELGGGDGADREGGHDQHDVAQDRGVEPGLALVQAEAALGELENFLDGLITNGKFCCVRRLQLSLSWWHRPLRLRGSVLQSDVALAGEPDNPDLDRVPPARSASRRRAPVGSGLSAAGGVGRAGQRAGSGADR